MSEKNTKSFSSLLSFSTFGLKIEMPNAKCKILLWAKVLLDFCLFFFDLTNISISKLIVAVGIWEWKKKYIANSNKIQIFMKLKWTRAYGPQTSCRSLDFSENWMFNVGQIENVFLWCGGGIVIDFGFCWQCVNFIHVIASHWPMLPQITDCMQQFRFRFQIEMNVRNDEIKLFTVCFFFSWD